VKGELDAPPVPREVDDLLLASDQVRVLSQAQRAGAGILITEVDTRRVGDAERALGMRP
jgi:hypothetical protein